MWNKRVILLIFFSLPVFFIIGKSSFAQQADIPTALTVEVDTVSQNLITWSDEGAITGESYNIYISEKAITNVSIKGVVKVGRNIPEGTEQFLHTLYTPSDTGLVSYFYAVTAVSPSGDENPVVISGVNTTDAAVTNKAIATGEIAFISDPVTIDGDIGEFIAKTKPFFLDSASAWVEGEVDGDQDLSAKIYLMVDAGNFYLGADVTDEALVQNYSGFGTWNGDAVELHVGLYPLPAQISHALRFKRASEPDYQFRISINEETWLHVPQPGRPDSGNPNHIVDYVDVALGPRDGGYFMEARIPFTELANDPVMLSHPGGPDSLFVPEEGMVIPFDITLNDADIDVYQGHIYYFWQGPDIARPFQDPTVWTQAIIGDFQTMPTAVSENPIAAPDKFTLSANYPNPFKLSAKYSGIAAFQTTIRYSLPQSENVSFSIYNILGQKIKSYTLIQQPRGEHSIHWDGRDEAGHLVAPGIYFYQLAVRNISQTRKMLVLY